ncbi:MAG: helix-turn-helix domain-containing protein [Streptosporangiales bacterium]|nr:helix-turn-helix domain-containing protein [Streptosporangiales bacterium]
MGGSSAVEEGTYRGSWRMWTRAPAPVLHGAVADYHGFVVDSGEPVSDTVLPAPTITLILTFGDELRMERMPGSDEAGGTFGSFVAGLHDGPGVIAHDGHQAGLQVDLSPLAAGALLDVRLDALTGDVVPLDALLGRAGDELAERLAEAPDWSSRFALLDDILSRRLAGTRAPTPEVAQAWQTIHRTGGTVRVADLAREIGWSRRHLAARFRAEIGLGPKAVGRLVRFSRARWMLSSGRARSLTDVALACGYYDHAHLDREFRALAGGPPSLVGVPPPPTLVDAEG